MKDDGRRAFGGLGGEDELMRAWLAFMIGSTLGWLYETANDLVCGRGFMLRETLMGPWCPIYGFGVVIIMAALGRFARATSSLSSKAAVALGSGAIAVSLEFLGSYLIEAATGHVPWDYSDYLLNFDGRIALRPALVFTVGALLIIYAIWPRVSAAIDEDPSTMRYLALFLLGLFVADMLIEALGVWRYLKHDLVELGGGVITLQGA